MQGPMSPRRYRICIWAVAASCETDQGPRGVRWRKPRAPGCVHRTTERMRACASGNHRRANTLVCVEADEIISRHEWQTVVIFGRYQELPDTPEFGGPRVVAHDLLAKTAMWWEPGYVKTLHQGEERPLQPIYFRISISKISGHQGLS